MYVIHNVFLGGTCDFLLAITPCRQTSHSAPLQQLGTEALCVSVSLSCSLFLATRKTDKQKFHQHKSIDTGCQNTSLVTVPSDTVFLAL